MRSQALMELRKQAYKKLCGKYKEERYAIKQIGLSKFNAWEYI
jgi:hypothetical protein